MSPTIKATVEAYQHACLRCNHAWWTFTPAPRSCAGCKSRYWNLERTRAPKRDARAMRNARYRKALRRKAREKKALSQKGAETPETGQNFSLDKKDGNA